nr:multidrug resistance-associated protein 4-like [Crassostrea gigas]
MEDKLKGPCPYSTANWLSRFTFWWVNPLFHYGFRHPLTQDHLYDILSEDQSHLLGDRKEKSWNTHVKKCEDNEENPSLYWAVIAEFKWEWGVNGFFLIASEGIRIVQPYLIGRIISYFQPRTTLSQTEVYIYATVVVVSHILQLFVNPKYYFNSQHIALKMKVALASLIYRKILKMSSWSKHSTTSGKIINHLSTDLEKFSYLLFYSDDRELPFLLAGSPGDCGYPVLIVPTDRSDQPPYFDYYIGSATPTGHDGMDLWKTEDEDRSCRRQKDPFDEPDNLWDESY